MSQSTGILPVIIYNSSRFKLATTIFISKKVKTSKDILDKKLSIASILILAYTLQFL